MKIARLAFILCKAAVFTAVAPFTIGLWLPTLVHRRYDPAHIELHPHFSTTIPSAFLFALGAAIYLWCAWDFSVQGLGTPAPIDAPRNLVIYGLYRFVRNPMYLGVFCLIGSRAVLFLSLRVVLYLLFVAACFQLFIVLYEEPHLRRVFGDQYLSYCRQVPRWIPRLRARL
jgi:protein-S-isoprenylcysteine O-methyltransferase Ste14